MSCRHWQRRSPCKQSFCLSKSTLGFGNSSTTKEHFCQDKKWQNGSARRIVPSESLVNCLFHRTPFIPGCSGERRECAKPGCVKKNSVQVNQSIMLEVE